MDIKEKITALVALQTEIGEALASKLNETLSLAISGNLSVQDSQNPSVFLTEFYYDKDLNAIVFVWDSENG